MDPFIDRTDSSEREKWLLELAVLKLRTEELLDRQQDIADRLEPHVSQPKVSAILRELKRKEVLIERPTINWAKVSEEDWQEMETRFFSATVMVKEKLRRLSPLEHLRVEIIHSAPENLSRAAAGVVYELIAPDDCRRIGVAFGRTLNSLIVQMRGDAAVKPAPRPKTIIPLCPEPLYLHNFDQDQRYSSSRLAVALQEVLNETIDLNTPLLRGVPAYVSTRFAGEVRNAIHHFIQAVPGYRKIFGAEDDPEPGAADDLDAILTGVGVARADDGSKEDVLMKQTGTFIKERMAQESQDTGEDQVSRQDFAEWTYGDISGILLPREGLSEQAEAKVNAMNEGWIGLRPRHLRDCCRRADGKSRPGVIAILPWPFQNEVAEVVVREGLVSTLVISDALARSIMGTDTAKPSPL